MAASSATSPSSSSSSSTKNLTFVVDANKDKIQANINLNGSTGAHLKLDTSAQKTARLARTMIFKSSNYMLGSQVKIKEKQDKLHQELDQKLTQLRRYFSGKHKDATFAVHPGIIDGKKTITQITFYTKNASGEVERLDVGLNKIEQLCDKPEDLLLFSKNLEEIASLINTIDPKGRIPRLDSKHIGKLNAPLMFSNAPPRIKNMMNKQSWAGKTFYKQDKVVQNILKKKGKGQHNCITGNYEMNPPYHTFFEKAKERTHTLENKIKRLQNEIKKENKKLRNRAITMVDMQTIKSKILTKKEEVKKKELELKELEMMRFVVPLFLLEIEKMAADELPPLYDKNGKAINNCFRNTSIGDLLQMIPEDIKKWDLSFDKEGKERVTFENLREYLAENFKKNFLQLMREYLTDVLPSIDEIHPAEEKFAYELGTLFFYGMGAKNYYKNDLPMLNLKFHHKHQIEVKRDIPLIKEMVYEAYNLIPPLPDLKKSEDDLKIKTKSNPQKPLKIKSKKTRSKSFG